MSDVFRQWALWVARRRVADGLDGLYVDGLDTARAALAGRPAVFAATHVAWWDPLVALLVADAIGGEHRFLMDAANLAKVRWFARLGATPIDLASPRAGLRAALDALGPGRAVWVFPQGRHRPPWLRPLGLRRGAAWLADHAGAALVPVAIAYGFREAAVPRAAVKFGTPCRADDLEPALIDALAATDAFLDGAPGAFTPLVTSARSPEQDGVASRLLGALVGP